MPLITIDLGFNMGIFYLNLIWKLNKMPKRHNSKRSNKRKRVVIVVYDAFEGHTASYYIPQHPKGTALMTNDW